MVDFRSVLVKRDADALMPRRAHDSDCGFDLFVSRPCVVPPNSFVDVHSGVAVCMPPGIWAKIEGRSSTLRRRGLLVSPGIIDQGYTGELYAGCWNLTDKSIVVLKGERLAQIIFCSMVIPNLDDVVELPKTDRNADGFGSSGQ